MPRTRVPSILAAALFAALTGACSATPASQAPTPQPGAWSAADSASAHSAATRFIAAFDSMQWTPFTAFFADDMTMFFPFPDVPARADGRAAVEAVFRPFLTAER